MERTHGHNFLIFCSTIDFTVRYRVYMHFFVLDEHGGCQLIGAVCYAFTLLFAYVRFHCIFITFLKKKEDQTLQNTDN